jgi:hypothetical protein
MTKTQSRVSENTRQFQGEDHGTRLVFWLNKETRPEPSSKALKRISLLLSLFTDLARYFPLRSRMKDDDPSWGKIFAAEKQLDRKLKFYRGVPILWYDKEGPKLNWGATNPKLGSHEMQAFDALLKLAREGLIGSVRQCEQCQRWIFARFRHQRFCPDGRCREKYFRSSESWKAHRRAYAKKLYRIHQSGKVR